MAGLLINFIDLAMTIILLGSVIGAILFAMNTISGLASTTKEKLKLKGYDVSSHGVVVHVQKGFNREEYICAMRRELARIFETSSFGKSIAMGPRQSNSIRIPSY